MKKKAIEKIPYLTLPKISRKKGVKYIGVTAIKIISHEKHLFVEIYKNCKQEKEIPRARFVLTKKDFGTYLPESGEWTRQKIEPYESYARKLIWHTQEDRTNNWEQLERENILLGDKDLERIKRYCGIEIWRAERWWEYIYRHQERIVIDARRKTERRKYERRQQALNERIINTRELPEKEILERADTMFFGNRHYLYYKKHGSFAQIACSKCGGVTDARWKAGISYESQFQRHIEEPREGSCGICPLCGARGEYKCQGKTKGRHSDKAHLFLGQKYKETGLVMRYVEVEKAWNLGLIATEKGEEMHNSSEVLSGVEVARAYFEPGKKVQIDYQKHDPYSGKDFWDDCNLSGIANIGIHKGMVLGETYEEMKGTMFQYSAMREYITAVGSINPIEYLVRYQETPQIEMLVKLGMTEIVNELIRCRYGIVVDSDANRPENFLGIRKERIKQLMDRKGDIGILRVMQMENRMKQKWTNEQIKNIAETGLGRGQIEQVLPYMTIQKLLNRIEKYAGCEYGTGCSGAASRIRVIAGTYTDYLHMRQELGYDLHNTVYQQPRNLTQEHNKMVLETNEKKMDKHIQEKEKQFPGIRARYKKLRNTYFYEDDVYMIRPARSAGEIILEGRTLHHCVGGDNYLRKHDSGETYILMLRFKADSETPYITVEIDAELQKIIQWYGKNDRKPDKEHMENWLQGYLKHLGEKEQIKIQAAIA